MLLRRVCMMAHNSVNLRDHNTCSTTLFSALFQPVTAFSCIDDTSLLLVLCTHTHQRPDGLLPNGQLLLGYIPIAAPLRALSASNSVFRCISLLLALCIHAHLRPDGLLPDDQFLLDYVSIAAPPSVPVCSILVPDLRISRHSCEHSACHSALLRSGNLARSLAPDSRSEGSAVQDAFLHAEPDSAWMLTLTKKCSAAILVTVVPDRHVSTPSRYRVIL